MPAGLSPTRSSEHREALDDADTAREVVDPMGDVSATEFPTIHRLRAGLAEDFYETEFTAGLDAMLVRVSRYLDDPST